MSAETLSNFWAVTIAAAALIYLILDGFDLGVGTLFGTTRDEAHKRKMLDAIAPVWDGNETWLVIVGASLYGAFPVVYAVLLPAFYLPVCLMLIALILRGVSFEFRYKVHSGRHYIDAALFIGSFTVSFVLGAAIGGIAQEIPMKDGAYFGGPFNWLTAFSVLCGLGMVAGQSLLGASWLVLKTEGALREWAYRRTKVLAFITLILLICVQVSGYLQHPQLASAVTRSIISLAALLGNIACVLMVLEGCRRRVDWMAFAFTAAIFILTFIGVAAAFWPHIIPFQLTIAEAAAPLNSLQFMFYGAGLIALPVALMYTAGVFWIFRGKITDNTDYDL